MRCSTCGRGCASRSMRRPSVQRCSKSKRLSEPLAPEIDVRAVPLGGRINLGPFEVEFVSVAHSIPESNALIIRTALGSVLHTGDWKIDPTPVLGPPTDEARLRALGDAGCLALVGDSTNAVREGRSPSEADVAKTLAGLIAEARGRVAVTTFASHVARLRAVAAAARAADREVVVVGRAMDRVVQVARETGYLDGVQDFRERRELRLSAARQGRRAVHRQPGRAAGCAVAHRSRRASRGDVGKRRPSDFLVAPDPRQREGDFRGDQRAGAPGRRGHHRPHPSGACVGSSAPRRNGETCTVGCARRSRSRCTARHFILPNTPSSRAPRASRTSSSARNGDLVRLAPGPTGVIDEVRAGRLYKDGRLIVDAEQRTVADRRRLGFAGIVTVAIALDQKGVMVANPEVDLIGIPLQNAEGDSIARIRRRRRDRHHRATAEGAAARSGIGGGSGARSGTLGHRGQLGQEAAMPRARAHRIEDDAAG